MTTKIEEPKVEEFDPDAVNQIDQETTEQGGQRFPSVQWHNGDPKMKKLGNSMDYMGGWFIKDGAVDELALRDNGWEKTEWTRSKGELDVGWWKRDIQVSVIAERKRWEVGTAPDQVVYGWGLYKEAKAAAGSDNTTGRTNALVLIKGLESIGCLVLTLKGTRSLAFDGSPSQAGALTHFYQTVIECANRASKASWEKRRDAALAAGKKFTEELKTWRYRAFWLRVGAARDAKGEPVFTMVGHKPKESYICLPVALDLPDKWDKVKLNDFYIGHELLPVANDLTEMAKTWVAEWPLDMRPNTPSNVSANGAVKVEEVTQVDNQAVASELGL